MTKITLVAELLESVIDAGKGMKLAKLEGDAAFFWAPNGDANGLVCTQLTRMRQSFLKERERIKKDHACDCECLDDSMLKQATSLTHDFESLGPTSTHYIDLATAEVVPPPPARGLFGRLWAKLEFELRSLPFLLGIKKACVGFRSLGR